MVHDNRGYIIPHHLSDARHTNCSIEDVSNKEHISNKKLPVAINFKGSTEITCLKKKWIIIFKMKKSQFLLNSYGNTQCMQKYWIRSFQCDL